MRHHKNGKADAMRTAYQLIVLIVVFSAKVCVADAITAKGQCAPIASAQNEVVDIIKHMYVELSIPPNL